MTIGQVITTTGNDPSRPQEERQKVAQAVLDRLRANDGCEGAYIFGDPSTGETISFNLWRDEAALKAAAEHQAQEMAAARAEGIEISEPKVFQLIAKV